VTITQKHWTPHPNFLLANYKRCLVVLSTWRFTNPQKYNQWGTFAKQGDVRGQLVQQNWVILFCVVEENGKLKRWSSALLEGIRKLNKKRTGLDYIISILRNILGWISHSWEQWLKGKTKFRSPLILFSCSESSRGFLVLALLASIKRRSTVCTRRSI
jgi:hypothetical protein